MVKLCPICGKPGEHGFLPFCSKRCADVDLHRWLSGSYAVPAAPSGSIEEDEALLAELEESLMTGEANGKDAKR